MLIDANFIRLPGGLMGVQYDEAEVTRYCGVPLNALGI